MKKVVLIAMVLAAAWPAAAKVISSCDSAPVEVDSRSGVKYEWATNVAKTCIGGMAKAEVYAATTTVVNCEKMGVPGLQRVTFTGSAYDASNIALSDCSDAACKTSSLRATRRV